jgi:hypothetical protein
MAPANARRGEIWNSSLLKKSIFENLGATAGLPRSVFPGGLFLALLDKPAVAPFFNGLIGSYENIGHADLRRILTDRSCQSKKSKVKPLSEQ